MDSEAERALPFELTLTLRGKVLRLRKISAEDCPFRPHNRDMSMPLLIAMSFFWQPVKDINQYVGVDLTQLKEKELNLFNYKLNSLFQKDPHDPLSFQERPLWIKPLNKEKSQWVLTCVYPGYNIPDASNLALYYFDSHFRPLSDEIIVTGYRIFVYQVTFEWNSRVQSSVIKVMGHAQGHFGPGEMDKDPRSIPYRQIIEYYVPRSTGTLLVHCENGEGKYRDVYYGSFRPTLGSVEPPNADKIASNLYSSDTASQISSLFWLSGPHIPSAFKRETNVSREPVESSQIFERFQSDLQIKSRVIELQKSTNEWVKYRADKALKNLSMSMEMPSRYEN